MSRRTVVDCNGCGQVAVEPSWCLFVATGRFTDAAGGSELDGPMVALCSECVARGLQKVLADRRTSFAAAQEWLEFIQTKSRGL